MNIPFMMICVFEKINFVPLTILFKKFQVVYDLYISFISLTNTYILTYNDNVTVNYQ